MSKIEQMFDYEGKTKKVIGDTRAQTYKEIYQHISERQKSKDLSTHKNYLGDNSYQNARSLHYERLFSAKFCHHHNVSEEDIDTISDAIEYVASNLKKKE